jgi:IS30 family transposase
MGRYLTDRDRQLIAALYKSGLPLKQIAHRTRRSIPTIYRALKLRGQPLRGYGKTTPIIIAEIVAMYRSGEKVDCIASKHQRSMSSVSRYARLAGLAMRGRGGKFQYQNRTPN